MKTITFCSILLFLSTCSDPYENKDRLATSTTGQIIPHTFYTLSYDEVHEQAEWVAYELTSDQTRGTLPRDDHFRTDNLILTGSAELEDYRGSGYDRGHLVPAGDMKFDRTAMSETFVFSNISPQKRGFNSGIWNSLEIQVRRWARKFDHLYVITGPVLNDPIERIGPNGVSVPSHYYKVILDYSEPEIKAIAFLIPHKNGLKDFSEFVVSIDEIEELTDIDFFPDFPESMMNKLESEVLKKPWFSNLDYQVPKELPRIDVADVQNYINQTCKVCGQIVDTYSSSSITHLNFGDAYPNQTFSAVIFDDYYKHFSYKPAEVLKGERVCIEGKVQVHKGKPQIVVRAERQIERNNQ